MDRPLDKLSGFRDFFPPPLPQKDQGDFEVRSYLFGIWREVLARYGFREYDGPPLESLVLFTKKSGEEIVGQLYNFEDKGGRAVALRPEMTPTLARMIAASERHYKKPMKWFSIPQLFRYERKQRGRLREHFQLNADIIGEAAVSSDAELIALLIDVLRAFGLTSDDFVVRLSSRDAWQNFFQNRASCESYSDSDSYSNAESNAESNADSDHDQNVDYAFFQVIDKMERVSEIITKKELDKFGISFEEVQNFIQEAKPDEKLCAVLDNLRARRLDEFVKVDYGIVRGLAYYTGVVFEAFDRKNEFRAIAGGGRYDRLIGMISEGKTRLPALGFGMGDVVLTELLRTRKLLPAPQSAVDVYCLIEEEGQRFRVLAFIQTLREAGFRVDYSMIPQRMKRQFREANEARAQLVLSLFQAPNSPVKVRIKRLSDRYEIIVSMSESVKTLRALLKNETDESSHKLDTDLAKT